MSATPNKYAIVTGGASGLGREFCVRLARDNWHIALVDIDHAASDATAKQVAAAGGNCRVELGDVTAIDTWNSLRDRLQADWPRLDLLINNAGMYAAGFVGSLDLAGAERLIRLNLMSVLYGCHAMVPWLAASAKERPARLINVASSFAFLCPPGMAPYNLSKAAVVALTETLRGELKPRGIGVTVVCPGPMPTSFTKSASFENETFRRVTESYVTASTLDPAVVAAKSLAAAERGELYVVLGADQRWYWRAKRWMPVTLLHRVARRIRTGLKRAT